MSRFQLTLLECLAVVGALSLATQSAHAQSWDDTGIVRVSDQQQPIAEEAAMPQADCPYTMDGSACPESCPHYCRATRPVHQFLDWWNPYGMHTFSPDHGWAPPVKRPIYRSPVVYRKNFPDAWTGTPVAYSSQCPLPTVYMPTDTTQLGYYYQHVPYWYPQPERIPPAPRPGDWHLSMCEANLSGRHPAGIIFGTAPTVPNCPMQAAPSMETPQLDACSHTC